MYLQVFPTKRAAAPITGRVKAVDFERLSATVLNMDFFDRLQTESACCALILRLQVLLFQEWLSGSTLAPLVSRTCLVLCFGSLQPHCREDVAGH